MQAFRLRGKMRSAAEFRVWLQEKDPSEQVGLTNNATCCPIGTWLAEADPAIRLVKVYPHEILAFGPEVGEKAVAQIATPAWIMRFIDFIDTANGTEEPISASIATGALDYVEAQEEK